MRVEWITRKIGKTCSFEQMDKRLWFKMEDPRVSLSLFDENVHSIVGLKRSRKIGL